MKKKLLLVVLLIACTLCFAEKWEKDSLSNSWGEVVESKWITLAQIVNTSHNYKSSSMGRIRQ